MPRSLLFTFFALPGRLTVLCAVAFFGVVGSVGCGSAHPTANPTAPSSNPASAALSGPRTIQVGDTVTGVIDGGEPECSFSTFEGGWGGVCDSFNIVVQSAGALTINVQSTGALAVFLKSATGAQIDMACCPGPLRVPVEAGTSYRIEVAYAGRPPGYPHIAPVAYALGAGLTPATEAQPSGSIRAVLFADDLRTQRMSGVRLEVLDGPRAGAIATFDAGTGIYEIAGLPGGFVQVRSVADGYIPLTARLPVGVMVANELVMHRLVPLDQTTSSLGGTIHAYPSKPGDGFFFVYSDVKVEILDGPLAGIFTLSDELGLYSFTNLPPGLFQLRVSKDGLETQVTSVLLSGHTIHDFVMKPR
jgi:hypothetical protein